MKYTINLRWYTTLPSSDKIHQMGNTLFSFFSRCSALCLSLLANPILVRELRQAVRNRVILYGLQFYLLTLVAAFFYAIFVQTFTSSNDMELGGQLFPILLNITFFTTLASLLLYTAGRLVFERINGDLMFYTTISPMGFVLGKMACGLVISSMFYSVSFPFLTLIYLMRGVEITTLLVATAFSFCVVQLFVLMVLVFFSGVDSWASAAVRLVAFLICGSGLFFFCATVLYALIMEEVFLRGNLQVLCVISTSLFVALPIPLLFLGSCQFAPIEANRMWAFRVAATVLLLPSFFICFALSGLGFHIGWGLEWSFFFWVIITIYPFFFFCFLSMHERERYGFRLRRNIPRSFLGRLVAFPFYTGDYNALAWLSCWFLLLLVTIPIHELMIKPHNAMIEICPLLAAALLTYGYVSFTLYLWSRFLYRQVAKAWIGLITLALLIIAFAGTYAAVYFTAMDIFDARILSPFFIFVPDYFPFLWEIFYSYHSYWPNNEWSVQLYFSLGVFALFLAVNLREMRRMFMEFKRVEDEDMAKKVGCPPPGGNVDNSRPIPVKGQQ